MSNVTKLQETTTINTIPLKYDEMDLQELDRQLRDEWQILNQIKRDELASLQAEINESETNQLAITNQNSQAPVRVNLLDTLDSITKKITGLEDPESYLQFRSEFLQMLKFCEKRLEKHDEKVFVDLMEKQQTDTLRFGKYEITYKPSKKTAIDPEKLKAVLPNPERFSLFLKKPEFKPLPECRRLLLKLDIWSDVYTVKQGKKPILNIVDTNTIRRELETADIGQAEDETEE